MPAKIYGFARFDRFADAPEEIVCTRCYGRRFARLSKPSPMARYVLGYDDITSRAYAHATCCDSCGKTLDA